MAFCHMKFLNKYTIHNASYFDTRSTILWLLSAFKQHFILKFCFFRADNRLVILCEREKKNHSKHVRDHTFLMLTWQRGGDRLGEGGQGEVHKICHVFSVCVVLKICYSILQVRGLGVT